MPFVSRSQEKAAFGGYLGKEMKDKAKEFASKTNQKNLPEHKVRAGIKRALNAK